MQPPRVLGERGPKSRYPGDPRRAPPMTTRELPPVMTPSNTVNDPSGPRPVPAGATPLPASAKIKQALASRLRSRVGAGGRQDSRPGRHHPPMAARDAAHTRNRVDDTCGKRSVHVSEGRLPESIARSRTRPSSDRGSPPTRRRTCWPGSPHVGTAGSCCRRQTGSRRTGTGYARPPPATPSVPRSTRSSHAIRPEARGRRPVGAPDRGPCRSSLLSGPTALRSGRARIGVDRAGGRAATTRGCSGSEDVPRRTARAALSTGWT